MWWVSEDAGGEGEGGVIPGGELAHLLGVVASVDQAHELGHDVPVEVGRPEGVLCAEGARREDDEVGGGHTRLGRRQGEHREDGGVRVVDRHRVDRVEPGQVVLVRHV